MEESFEIPVTYKNTELIFPAVLQRVGYSYRIVVQMGEIPICFERMKNAISDRDDAGAARSCHGTH
jgi:hypothetical protein